MKLYSGLYSTELFRGNAVKHLAQMISSTAVGLCFAYSFYRCALHRTLPVKRVWIIANKSISVMKASGSEITPGSQRG